MPVVHRHGDLRSCGATTVVQGQSTVFVNSKLWSVQGDPNTHINGPLLAVNGTTVTINGKRVITIRDPSSSADNLGHNGAADAALTGSGSVAAYYNGPLVDNPEP